MGLEESSVFEVYVVVHEYTSTMWIKYKVKHGKKQHPSHNQHPKNLH